MFVAQDGPIKLYATTNREGTYCLVVDAPWKHANAGDGGSCVDMKAAAKPLTAWVVGLSALSKTGEATIVVAGRVDSADARTVRFDDPAGAPVERRIGSSGFYIAAIHGKPPIAVVRPEGVTCPANGWKPTFVAMGADGESVSRASIPLMESPMCASTSSGH